MGLKERLRAGKTVVGSWLSLANPAIAEIMCEAGFEWIAIDLEHSTTSLSQAEALIRVIDGHGRAPLVRLSTSQPEAASVQIKRVMDAGAHGIILPMVCDRETLESAWRAMHYPPGGTRGVGLSRAQGYGARFESYRAWLEDSAVLVAQIEHRDALDHLDEIFGFDGLDATLVGPYDLSASLGHPGSFDHPRVTGALKEIQAAANEHGVPAGIHVVEPDPELLRARIAEGYRFVAYSVDFRMVDVACRAALSRLELGT